MELTLVGLQNSGKTTLVNVIAVSKKQKKRKEKKKKLIITIVRAICGRFDSDCRI